MVGDFPRKDEFDAMALKVKSPYAKYQATGKYKFGRAITQQEAHLMRKHRIATNFNSHASIYYSTY
jgi:hypothetical protein